MSEDEIKKILNNIVYILCLTILIIVGVYILNFHNHKISDDTANWAEFGDFVGGTLNSIVGILNLFLLAYLTLKIAKIETTRHQNNLTENVKPLGLFSFKVSTNSIYIKYHNVGIGPLIVSNFKILYKEKKYDDFSEIIKSISVPFRPSFSITKSTKSGSIIIKDNSIKILKISITEDSSDFDYSKKLESINKIKNEISKCEILVKYKDLYGNEFIEQKEDLQDLSVSCE